MLWISVAGAVVLLGVVGAIVAFIIHRQRKSKSFDPWAPTTSSNREVEVAPLLHLFVMLTGLLQMQSHPKPTYPVHEQNPGQFYFPLCCAFDLQLASLPFTDGSTAYFLLATKTSTAATASALSYTATIQSLSSLPTTLCSAFSTYQPVQ